ncbi:uncharacterized protein [Coffea arabica]
MPRDHTTAKAHWDENMEIHFCMTYVEWKKSGEWNPNIYTEANWMKLAAHLNSSWGKQYMWTVYHSKYTRLRRIWHAFAKLKGLRLSAETGIGWDENRRCFMADESQWRNLQMDAVGAIDGTHIPASVSSGQQVAYTNRHGVQSQNVLAVCDHDMRFAYVYAGWEGSAHDARVLDGALTYPNHFPMPPQANTTWLIPRTETYPVSYHPIEDAKRMLVIVEGGDLPRPRNFLITDILCSAMSLSEHLVFLKGDLLSCGAPYPTT